MNEISIALSILSIIFFIAKQQLRIYHQEPPTFWHDKYNGTYQVPLFVTPPLHFGPDGKALTLRSISYG